MVRKLGRFRASRIVNLIAIFLFLYAIAFADYHYASHNGSNSYPYTSWETAADTIQSAIDAADPRDTVFIGSGEYVEDIYMTVEDSLISIIGMGMDSTWIHVNQAALVMQPGPKAFIKNIHFSNTGINTNLAPARGWDLTVENCRFGRGRGIFINSSHVSVRNCIFEGIGANNGIQGLYENYYLEVANCLFRDLNAPAIDINTQHGEFRNNITTDQEGGPAFYLHTTSNGYNLIENNVFKSIWYGALYIAFTDSTSDVKNNIINKQNDQYHELSPMWIYLPSMNGEVVNNSITNYSGWGLVLYGNHELSANYNNFWNKSDSCFDIVNNGSIDSSFGLLHLNPMFNNPDSGDFRLQAYSPLIDAGDPEILDYDGSRSDIGAFGGPGGYFYEYRDLPPSIPDSLNSATFSDTILITWKMNSEADFNRYIIWRDTISGFTPWAGNIIAEPDTSRIIDLNWDSEHNYYYRIAAYDNQWNLSGLSNELAVINVGIWGEPLNEPYTTYIDTNYPNPFNDATTISFFVANVGPQPAEITFEIYDVLGRRVSTLLKEKYEPGRHQITWDGRDDNGNPLSSGVYFARISQWGIDFINKPKKLVILR